MRASLLVSIAALLAALAPDAAAQDAPRGLAPLGLLHAKYKGNGPPGSAGRESIADILRASPRPEVAVLFTTFGLTYENAAAVVRPLIAEGRRPRVALYLLNGPGRRNDSRRPHIDFYPRLRPDEFREKWRRMADRRFVDDFKRLILAPTRAFVDDMNVFAAQGGQPAPEFILVPELEDNFGNGSDGMRALGNLIGVIRGGFAGVANVSYRRNPLAGDDSYRVAGLTLEKHSYLVSTLDRMRRGDTVTGDGAHFNFPEERQGSTPITVQEPVATFDDVKRLLERGKARGVGVLLWRAEWQGLGPNASASPSRRRYSFPAIGSTQHGRLRELMSHGAPGSGGGSAGGGGGGGSSGGGAAASAIRPNGTRFDGPEGFLWKPASDSDGKLVVLAPKSLTGKIQECRVLGLNGAVLERGRYSGIGNGDREHFRFGKPGAQYPRDVVVAFRLKAGGATRYLIPDPAQRYD